MISRLSSKSAAQLRRLLATSALVIAYSLIAAIGAQATCIDFAGGRPASVCDTPESCGYDSAKGMFALVLGNSSYENAALPNASTDAADMARILEERGFDVRCVLNASRQEAKTEIKLAGRVAGKMQASGANDLEKLRLVFYFAGHGRSQSLVSKGFVRLRDGGELSVEDDIFRELRFAAPEVVPFMVIDACRAVSDPPGSDGVFAAAPKSMRSIMRPTTIDEHFIGYSVAAGQLASDSNTKRFMTSLSRALRLRGLTMEDTCLEARTSYIKAHELTEETGPQCISHSNLSRKRTLVTNSACETPFYYVWQAVQEASPSEFGLQEALQDSRWRRNSDKEHVCQQWKEATTAAARIVGPKDPAAPAPTACYSELVGVFGNYYQRCAAIPVNVAEYTVSGGPEALNKARLLNASADGAKESTRAVRSKGGDTSGGGAKSSAWPELVVASVPTNLHETPEVNGKRHATIKAGTTLTVDCASRPCSSEWLAVRRPTEGGLKKATAFIPAGDVKAVAPTQTLPVNYRGSAAAPDSASAAAIKELASSLRENPQTRVRISARYGPSGTKDAEAVDTALMRISVVEDMLGLRGGQQRLPNSVKTEFVESADQAIPLLTVETFDN